MTDASPGRVAAARALIELERRGGRIEALLDRTDLDGPERKLAWSLVMGVERRRSLLDHHLRPHLSRLPAQLDPEVRSVLRCAALQVMYLDRIPDRAAVHQAVETARALGVGRASALVNASLRSLVRQPDRAGEATEPHTVHSMPRWLLRRMVGGAAAAFNEEPLLALRPRRGDVRRRLSDAGVAVHAPGEPLARTGALLVERGDPTILPGWEEGRIAVQDAAAQAVVKLVGARPGETVLDACAAPGGKSFALSDAVGPSGRIVALDLSGERLERLRQERRRLGVTNVEVRCGDLHDGVAGTFDRVVVDAPCSAIGTLRRHPEVRWQRRESDLPRYASRQLALLLAASGAVRPGGVLVYAVCSFAREEGEDVIERFLQEASGFAPAPIDEAWGPARTRSGGFRSWPTQGPWDAFFAAVVRRQRTD